MLNQSFGGAKQACTTELPPQPGYTFIFTFKMISLDTEVMTRSLQQKQNQKDLMKPRLAGTH